MDFLEALTPFLAVTGAVLAAVVLAWILRRIAARTLRKVPQIQEVTRKSRGPLQAVLAVLGIRIALGATARDTAWFPPVDYVLVLALIVSLAWLLVAVLSIIETVVLRHYESSGRDNRRARRLKTQIMLARRVAVAVIITLALASVLLTIDEVRALGAGILASAGLISIVAGLAVQSSLSNVFAGVQLAFTDAIRVDDVVLVEGEMGTIEEITMTYVVVQSWDERRIILPSTYFTSTPFENWTRRRSELLGTVELDLDWRVPIEQMRAKLRRSSTDPSCGTDAPAPCRSPARRTAWSAPASWSARRTAVPAGTFSAWFARRWSGSSRAVSRRRCRASAGRRCRRRRLFPLHRRTTTTPAGTRGTPASSPAPRRQSGGGRTSAGRVRTRSRSGKPAGFPDTGRATWVTLTYRQPTAGEK